MILKFDFQRDEVSFFFLLSHPTALPCIHTEDTTLYHDTESQVLLAELDYPAPVENAEQRYLGMETADRNGDGSSDVLLRFSQEDGTLELLFCWDPETGAFQSVPA